MLINRAYILSVINRSKLLITNTLQHVKYSNICNLNIVYIKNINSDNGKHYKYGMVNICYLLLIALQH